MQPVVLSRQHATSPGCLLLFGTHFLNTTDPVLGSHLEFSRSTLTGGSGLAATMLGGGWRLGWRQCPTHAQIRLKKLPAGSIGEKKLIAVKEFSSLFGCIGGELKGFLEGFEVLVVG